MPHQDKHGLVHVDHPDVEVSGLIDGQVLEYEASSSKWKNKSVSGDDPPIDLPISGGTGASQQNNGVVSYWRIIKSSLNNIRTFVRRVPHGSGSFYALMWGSGNQNSAPLTINWHHGTPGTDDLGDNVVNNTSFTADLVTDRPTLYELTSGPDLDAGDYVGLRVLIRSQLSIDYLYVSHVFYV